MYEMEFKFCLVVFESTKLLAAESTANALRNQQCKQAFVKENEKNTCVKEI